MQENELKKAGLKITLPRIKILEILENSDNKHMTAEDVYKIFVERGEDIGIATVYRVLNQFESSGIVSRHRFDNDSSVYELCTGVHHDHLVCVKCSKVVEFVDHSVEERQEIIAKEKGFEITDHSLTIYGICAECRSK